MVVCDRCHRGDVGLRNITITVAREVKPMPQEDGTPTVILAQLCQGCEDRTIQDLNSLVQGKLVA